MVYILFNSDKIYGIYMTIELLKTNAFIYTYELYKNRKITKEVYFDIKARIFDVALVDLAQLQAIVKPAGIHTEYYELEKNGSTALKNILEHIDARFDELEMKMSMDSRVTITIPGKSAIDNMMVTGEIEDVWRELDPENFAVIIDELKSFIMKKIQKLQINYDGRILFGNVSDTQASSISYQVWPADMVNWDLPENTEISGDGFAFCFKYQVPGVFGIVTNPLYGYIF